MELNGLVEELSKYATISGSDKIRLKLAIRKLRRGTAASRPATARAYRTNGAPNTNESESKPRARGSFDGGTVVTREQLESITKLQNHIKSLENCHLTLKNKQNQINENKQESERMIDEICDCIIAEVNSKRKELKNKTNDFFKNDCARIAKDLSSVERELTSCNKHKNDHSNIIINGATNGPLNISASPVDYNRIDECLKYNVKNVSDTEYKTDKNVVDIIYDNGLVESISKEIQSIDVDIELNDSKDEEYIAAKEYCQSMSELLDKTASFERKKNEVKQLPSLKDVRMMFPKNLNAQNGCIVLGKHTEIYDIANGKNITPERMKAFYKNKCYVKQEMNKKAIFGGRGKNIYLAIVTDIYNHIKINKYNKLLLLKLDKYINNNKYKECNSKSLLYQFINESNDSQTLKEIEKGQSLLESIREGIYRLTNEELRFLQYGKMDVGKAVEHVRSTTLLLKLKEFEQSQIPFIQEKKAMMAASKDNNDVDLNKLMSNAQTLRQREEFEVSVFRQINRAGLGGIEQAIANNKIPFSKQFNNHKEIMILCAQCQMAMIKHKCVKSAIESCQNVVLVKELRRIMICNADPREKFGFYVCKFKYDTSCPQYCTELEYLIDGIDAKIEILQAKMLE